jgi:hypothetical protein
MMRRFNIPDLVKQHRLVIIPLLGFLLFLSCDHTRNLKFQVTNSYSSKIFVNYKDLNTLYGNPYADIIVYVHPGETRTVLSYTSTSKYYYPYWQNLYKNIRINSIATAYGDTINFDPNVAHEWQFIDEDPDSYYILNIDSTSF